MRNTADRIRHAITFEVIGLVFLIGGGALLTGFDVQSLGVIGVVSSLVATGWVFAYNWIFDRAMLRLRGSVLKTHPIRALHTLLFEAGLLVILLPFIAWMLDMTLWRAFLFDIGVVIFYLLYGYAFNWAYDRVFPLPEARARAAQAPSNSQRA